jgi:urease accessory protein
MGEVIVRPRPLWVFGIVVCVWLVLTGPTALAHHVMGGKLPASLLDGLLSGLGHPIVGVDHLAAVLAVGLLAAAHRLGPMLIVSYVLAQVAGAAGHVQGASVPAAEILVALSVIGLGALLLAQRALPQPAILVAFALAGLFHGYALAESIIGAEPGPLYAYFIGFAAIQIAIALAVMGLARNLPQSIFGQPINVRLIGAGIVGLGIGAVMTQLVAAS